MNLFYTELWIYNTPQERNITCVLNALQYYIYNHLCIYSDNCNLNSSDHC